MDIFKTDAERKAGKTNEERANYVRRGGRLDVFKPADVASLQEYALDIKDIRLYDYLNQFWAGHQHTFDAVDCARPMVCKCGAERKAARS